MGGFADINQIYSFEEGERKLYTFPVPPSPTSTSLKVGGAAAGAAMINRASQYQCASL